MRPAPVGFWWWQWTGDVTCQPWQANLNSSLVISGMATNPGSGCWRAHGYHAIIPPPGYTCTPSCDWDETSYVVCH
jgi:hypothetical protein